MSPMRTTLVTVPSASSAASPASSRRTVLINVRRSPSRTIVMLRLNCHIDPKNSARMVPVTWNTSGKTSSIGPCGITGWYSDMMVLGVGGSVVDVAARVTELGGVGVEPAVQVTTRAIGDTPRAQVVERLRAVARVVSMQVKQCGVARPEERSGARQVG